MPALRITFNQRLGKDMNYSISTEVVVDDEVEGHKAGYDFWNLLQSVQQGMMQAGEDNAKGERS